ncbi:hypothetical protein [Ferroplasma sp.]|uniref:hypothetical protein n=1 Tax=Ferroplasma sp. TaxID=2591003 RepID=UPI00261082DB|nr:hypothetical protein [Ferroplasma sp.]
MLDILDFLLNRIIIGVIVVVIATMILKYIEVELNNKSKFSREFIINSIFNIETYYSNLIRKLNKYPNIKFLLYETFIILTLPAIYFNLIQDFYIVVSAIFGLYIIFYILWYATQYFKKRIERRNDSLPLVNISLKRLQYNYEVNNILSHYLVIWSIILTFYLIDSLGNVIDYTYTLDNLLLLLLVFAFIFLFVTIINYFIYLKNINNKIEYINMAYKYHLDDIMVNLVLTSNIPIKGRLCYINFDSLTLSNDGFKAIIRYKKIEFIEVKIENEPQKILC